MRHVLSFSGLMVAAGHAVIVVPSAMAADPRPILDAIRAVESSNNPTPPDGDDGRSIGPYQIQRAYWRDSGVRGRYEWCRNRAYAERVVLAYWQRHCPAAMAAGDWQTCARIHNGGPSGARKTETIGYWARVRRHLR